MGLTGFDTIEHAFRTDVGMRRSHNQDAYAIDPAGEPDRFREHGHLFLVADGMGGHAVGEKASAKAVRDIPHTYHKYVSEGPAEAIRKAFVEANAGIHAIGLENPEFRGLGTTASGLLLRPEGAWVGHVGDSRVYRVRGGQVDQLTFDHSAVWEIAKRQQVNPEELHGIRSNVILRSLGPDALVEVDIEGPHPIQPGDVFLICSDGLSGQLSDYEIGAVAGTLPPAEACEFLVELANLRGGPDNITVVIVKVGGSPEPDVPSGAAAPGPRPRKPLPWPLSMLFVGIALAILAVVLLTSELPGGGPAFVLAAAAIGVGLFGIGMQGQRDLDTPPEPPKPRLQVYRSARCRIEKPLLEKLIKAEDAMKHRIEESKLEISGEYAAFRQKADDAMEKGELTEAFREHCRAMNVLIKSFNQQKQKEEVFQPVWDKHIAN